MKQKIFLIAFIFTAAVCSNLNAQVAPPPVTGDKDLRDTDIKRRSVDMERIERDAKKPDKTSREQANKAAEDKLAAKYEEIKTDYEQIQLSQDAILKVYQGSGKIDYAQIGKSAREINKSAKRLNLNLFSLSVAETEVTKKEEKKQDKTEPKTKSSKGVRDLIIDLDNAVGSFVTSPMFQNLRVVDAEISKKARLDLEKIIELSALLDAEAEKMKENGN